MVLAALEVVMGIISAATAAGTAIASAVPTAEDKYIKWRLPTATKGATEGYTAQQEADLRQLGMEQYRTSERETEAQRAEKLGNLSAGPSARDINSAEAQDAERLRKARMEIERQITVADQAEKDARLAEVNQLTQKKKEGQRARASDIMGAVQNVGKDVVSIAEMSYNKTQGGTVIPGKPVDYTGTDFGKALIAKGFDPAKVNDLGAATAGMTDEQRQNFIDMFGGLQ